MDIQDGGKIMEDLSLSIKRDQLKEELIADKNKTIMDMFFYYLTRPIQQVTNRSWAVSFLLSVLFVAALILIPGMIAALYFAETEQLKEFGLITVIGLELSLAALITAKFNIGYVLQGLHDYIIDSIESEDNLTDLQNWINNAWVSKKSLAFVLFVGTLISVVVVIMLNSQLGEFIGIGITISIFLICIFLAIAIYYIFIMLLLPPRLSGYQFELYFADPSSSAVIINLARILNVYTYVIAAFSALLTLYTASHPILTNVGILVVLVGWIPVTTQFISDHISLRTIIMRAQYKTMQDVQVRVKEKWTDEHMKRAGDVEIVTNLILSYERIKSTPNSALNFGAGISLLNQLLLPVLAFVIANMDRILAYIR
jgi:hypothetical protein